MGILLWWVIHQNRNLKVSNTVPLLRILKDVCASKYFAALYVVMPRRERLLK